MREATDLTSPQKSCQGWRRGFESLLPLHT